MSPAKPSNTFQPRPTRPVIVRGTKGLVKALLNVGTANPEVIQERRRACSNCHHAVGLNKAAPSQPNRIGITSICRVCNCLLQAKTLLAEETCPASKWFSETVRPSSSSQVSEQKEALAAALEHLRAGRTIDAEALCHEILHIWPGSIQAQHLLAMIFQRRGNLAGAIKLLQQALRSQPAHAEMHNTLGSLLGQTGKHTESLQNFKAAMALRPDYAEAFNNAGNALVKLRQLEEAIASYKKAIELKPDYAEAHHHLGLAYNLCGNTSNAIACHRAALALRPRFAQAHHGLAEALIEEGNAARAVEEFQHAAKSLPNDAVFHSDLLFSMHYLDSFSKEQIFAEHRDWARQHGSIHQPVPAKSHYDRSPDRRLRVGYVSPDFRDHSCGRFIEPLLAAHDHQQFEIVCYSDVLRSDAATARIKDSVDLWRSTRQLSHEALAELIGRDQIDILVDMTGHMAGNRLLTFARKPAPVQITYRGYTDTTGLEAIQYCITDWNRDPPGAEGGYSERLVRLPRISQVYGCNDSEARIADDLPVARNGLFTFGSLNRAAKHTPAVIDVWSKILRAVPSSRFMLLAGRDGNCPKHTSELFAYQGIDSDRIVLASPRPRLEYLKLFNEIDLALDPFPYNGHTTSLDGLFMGVPFVTLIGSICVSRIGFSLLDTLGLSEFIAADPATYVRLAIEQARNLQTLADLRLTLRDRLRHSPLCDALGHTRALENSLRQLWRQWCQGSH